MLISGVSIRKLIQSLLRCTFFSLLAVYCHLQFTEADGVSEQMFPNMARMRNLT